MRVACRVRPLGEGGADGEGVGVNSETNSALKWIQRARETRASC